MGFFKRLSNGWKLGMTSLKVIRDNKQLLMFPVVSSIALIIVTISFLGGGYLLFGLDLEALDEGISAGQAVTLFLFYFVNYFVIVYFNVALIHCARIYFQGEKPSLSDGISFSNSRLPQIAGWAVIAATVGFILKAIEEIHEGLGAIVAMILGSLWGALTFFVIPVIAYENVSPIGAVKQSGRLLRKKWGESIGAGVGIGVVGFVAILLIAVPLGVIGWLIHPAIGIVLGITAVLAISAVMSAANTVFVAAVYHHVTGEEVAIQPFDSNILDDVFVEKKKKKKWF